MRCGKQDRRRLVRMQGTQERVADGRVTAKELTSTSDPVVDRLLEPSRRCRRPVGERFNEQRRAQTGCGITKMLGSPVDNLFAVLRRLRRLILDDGGGVTRVVCRPIESAKRPTAYSTLIRYWNSN